MRKWKFFFGMVCFISVALVACLFVFETGKTEAGSGTSTEIQDIFSVKQGFVLIDCMRYFGDLKRPAVVFPHSRHTKALLFSGSGLDCTSCHMLFDDGRLSSKFKRLVSGSYDDTMKLYHDECLGCHSNMVSSKNKNKTGPTTCGGCHSSKRFENIGLDTPVVNFDKCLHYKHIQVNLDKCDTCHHEYDEDSKQLVYKKGNENPCSYCHGKENIDKVGSFREVSHQFCVGCHFGKSLKSLESGPIECVGCHSSNVLERVSNDGLENVPRLNRGQPDRVIVRVGSGDIEKSEESDLLSRMSFVPFDHKSHEGYNDTCVGCHHVSLEPCSDCHKLGDFEVDVSLTDAVHGLSSNFGCIGCHKSKQSTSQCAGCHSFGRYQLEFSDLSCNNCHLIPISEALITIDSKEQRDKIIDELFAGILPGILNNCKVEEIPETVKIDKIQDEYGPVFFPHRKVALSLLGHIQDSKLATHFHGGSSTLCLGCHHNSPVSEKPPVCGDCHGSVTSKKLVPFKPRLSTAYHQRCIQCHNAMNLEKPDSRDCNACHEKKNSMDDAL